jgi:hypothetical protein
MIAAMKRSLCDAQACGPHSSGENTLHVNNKRQATQAGATIIKPAQGHLQGPTELTTQVKFTASNEAPVKDTRTVDPTDPA